MTEDKRIKIEEFLNTLKVDNVDIPYYVDIDEIDLDSAFDSSYDMITEQGGFDIDIIYYISAMDYLRENDISLKHSLELASDMGFEAKDLNSELLASLLASEYARDDFAELRTEITEFFEDLENE